MIACQYCSMQNRADATYCNRCGGLLPGAKPATAARRPPAPSAPTAPSAPHHATGRLPLQSLLAGRYVILKNVGQGGMAAVYMATDTRTSRTVAIKEMGQDGLSPEEVQEALESFRFEAKTLRRLRHPNLPRVYEQFSEDARHYLVMEFIDGETLEHRLGAANGAGLPEAEVLGWARQLCSALSYLHSQRPPIIFRDLKPSNIMVSRAGEIKLIDFGIARVFAPGRTRDTQVLGTPGYAPPEQYGKAQTDARADIYALGATLYQLFSGYDPANTPFALPPLHTRAPNVAPHVQLAIERATKLDRDARYQTVAAFDQDLLHPAGFYFRTGECAHNRDELVALCLRQPAEAAEHLYAGRVEGWLRAWGESGTATSAGRAVRANADRAAGLRAFIASVNGRAAASGAGTSSGGSARIGATAGPRSSAGSSATTQTAAATATASPAVVTVTPRSLHFGKLIAGQRGTLHFLVSGQSWAKVQGQINSLVPWLIVDHTQFNGTNTLVQVAAETSKLASPGLHQANVQISCGSQRIFLPVTVEVLAATSGSSAKNPTAASTPRVYPTATKPASTTASRAQPAPTRTTAGASAAKYTLPKVQRPRLVRMAASYTMAFGLAVAGLFYMPQVVEHFRSGASQHWPVALLALLMATALTIPGAWAGSRPWTAPGRVRAIAIGAVSGLVAALISTGPLVFSHNGELLAAALASGGATLGADSALGRVVLSIAGFVTRRIQAVVTLTTMIAGAWAGVLLAGHAGAGFVPLGLIFGAIFGLALGSNLNRLLARMTRVARAYP